MALIINTNANPRMRLLPIPKLKKMALCWCGILNLFLPGVGLMIATCIENNGGTFNAQMGVGLMQFLLCFVVVGFFWSIANGIVMIYHAMQ
ncbi:Transmembrane_domain-containing protein [Hexamita inflata]|uniref:Transmembrane domain-containing protein n=1 Tax=Hexamita inflata TaxID=28002 RepID=A0AA86UNF6_9EUKA|nr:Transmembrane domain-containing protein [Hexamita inflata]CAI9965038.1 Transmembrane domain-containing protein [Hexamita inflata]